MHQLYTLRICYNSINLRKPVTFELATTSTKTTH